MKRLSKEKRKEIENFLVNGTRLKQNGYIVLGIKRNKKTKRIKRGRAYFQLIYGLELTHNEIIHHIDGNKENDDIKNLELTNIEEHSSLHHGGSKKNFKKR